MKGGVKREHFGRTLQRRLLLWSIRPGRYTLTAWGGPYLPIRVPGIDVVEGQPAPQVEVVFAAKGGVANVAVTAVDGSPTPALVSWRRLDAPGHVPRQLTTHPTDDAGVCVHRGLPAGRYRFSAFHEERGIADAEVDLDEDVPADVEIRLPG